MFVISCAHDLQATCLGQTLRMDVCLLCRLFQITGAHLVHTSSGWDDIMISAPASEICRTYLGGPAETLEAFTVHLKGLFSDGLQPRPIAGGCSAGQHLHAGREELKPQTDLSLDCNVLQGRSPLLSEESGNWG